MLTHHDSHASFASRSINRKPKPIQPTPEAKRGSQEWKFNISESKKGFFVGKDNPFYGKHHTEKSNQKNREQHLNKKHSKETIERRSVSITEKWKDPEYRKKQIESRYQLPIEKRKERSKNATSSFWNSLKTNPTAFENHCNKIREAKKGIIPIWTKETKEIGRKKNSIDSLNRWANPDYKENTVKKMIKASHIHPNNQEIFTDNLIQTSRPTDFIYSGAGEIIIGGKNPDWFNVNGKKQVIELFGDWWHGEKFTGRIKEQEEEFYKSHYDKYGYDCLIIWEYELKYPDKVRERIRSF
jgi:hypothetical protein